MEDDRKKDYSIINLKMF